MSAIEEAGVAVEKKSLIAAEQDRPDVKEHRRNYAIARRFVPPGSFVFLDESGAKTNMTRPRKLYGRAMGGERCVDKTPFRGWGTMTMISAIREQGVLESASVVLDGAMDGSTFLAYVQQCLVPALRPGDVVVMDNLRSHKVAGAPGGVKRLSKRVAICGICRHTARTSIPLRSCGARSNRG